MIWSLPMRERGLKLVDFCGYEYKAAVAPHAGAWIETVEDLISSARPAVAPHAGAWIETAGWVVTYTLVKSLPMRERGLKQADDDGPAETQHVAPHAGAWIET